MARKRYLKKIPLQEARSAFLARIDPASAGEETIAVSQALGRITSRPVYARISSPHYHAAAMDGIGVRAEDTFGATEFSPVRLRRSAGEEPAAGGFAYVDTGNALPPWANAVIMIEKVRQVDEDTVEIFESVAPWHNVRLVGEDIVATELLLPRGHELRPYDLGALLAAGNTEITVRARPRVAIIPTGNELVEPGVEALPGQVIEFNSAILASLVREAGGEPGICAKAPDDPAILGRALEQALADSHIVAIIAGSSAGERDFTAQVIESRGELIAHGIDVMPGKPAVLGFVGGRPVIGVPGYPVSAVVIARELLVPAVARLLGAPERERPRARACVVRKIPSHLGLEEFVRVTLGRVGEKLIAVPLGRGAGAITTMVKADGFLRIPSMVEGLNAGEEVEVELLRPLADIDNTILCTGSHDLAIGVLEDRLKATCPELKIAAANVGSLGGLISLRRGETHVAGTHLLDPDTGAYNVADIRRHLPGLPLVLVHLAEREQGLLVRKGNPKGIRSLEDLARPDVVFRNRQPGSGTRVLLDFKLKELGLEPREIRGYAQEEFTHMAVAVAVTSGLADVGLGVRSAAVALGLDFVPVASESYELIFLGSFFESDRGRTLLSVIRSAEFKRALDALGGYGTRRTGEIVYRQ